MVHKWLYQKRSDRLLAWSDKLRSLVVLAYENIELNKQNANF